MQTTQINQFVASYPSTNDAWTFDPGRSEKHDKQIFVTNITKLDQSYCLDPWFKEMPKGMVFWFTDYEDPEKKACTSITYKTKNPNGTEIGLCVLNLNKYD